MIYKNIPPKTFPINVEGLWQKLQERNLSISPPAQLPDGRFYTMTHLKEVVHVLVLLVVIVAELHFLDLIKHELPLITPQKVLCHP